MNDTRYDELNSMSFDDINKLSLPEKEDIRKEFIGNHNLSPWPRQFLPKLSLQFFVENAKDFQELLDNLFMSYKEKNVDQFEKDLIEFCKNNNIYQEEFDTWCNDFSDFLTDNRTFRVDWIRAHVLNMKPNLDKIPNFPFKITNYNSY